MDLLPLEIWNTIVDSGLSDIDKINFVIVNPTLEIKPHLTEIYTAEQLERLERRINFIWRQQETLIPITELFFLSGIIVDTKNPIPKKYEKTRILFSIS